MGVLSDGFSNVESQYLRLIGSFDGSGGQSDVQRLRLEEPVLDLDRNELAEMKYVRGISTISTRDDAEDNQSETGNVRADHQVSINDFPDTPSPESLETVQEVGSISDTRAVGEATEDGARILAKFNQVVAPQAFGNNGEGSGPDTGETTVWEIPYHDMPGGPVLDRFDEIQMETALKADNLVTRCSFEHAVQIWYVVDEFEDRGIQSFGRP
jgi:hypothetical protein